MDKEKIVFVIPTYNTYEKYSAPVRDRGRVKRPFGFVLDDLLSALKRNLQGTHEVLVSNDGCTDITEDRVIRLLEKRGFKLIANKGQNKTFSRSSNGLNLRITILKHETRQGLTPAVMTGYREALKRKPTFVIKMDSDGEHDPSDFPKLIENIKENKSNLEWLREDKFGLGLGFRILKPNALSQIMPALEEYTRCLYKSYPDNPEKRRRIDRKTDHLIDALNEKRFT